MIYHIPFESKRLSELLKLLNELAEDEQGTIKHYGISSVTLEEIFRKIHLSSEVRYFLFIILVILRKIVS